MLLAVWVISMVVYWSGDSVGFEGKCVIPKSQNCVVASK